MNGVRLLAVTNRRLCTDERDFLRRIAQLAAGLRDFGAILLREKDLSPAQYAQLAQAVRAQSGQTPLILHSHPDLAAQAGLPVHLPLPLLGAGLPPVFGASVHSVEEAGLAARRGAAYLIAGHIFPTACKPGLPARGLAFLRAVAGAASIPVYAIGGITPKNAAQALETGAAGLCVMSHFMTCPDLPAALAEYRAVFQPLEKRICKEMHTIP